MSLHDGGAGIRAVLFDWGGVLAEEGFREGLKAIARQAGLDPEAFFDTAVKVIWDTGYVVGRADEAEFWHALRAMTGLERDDADLRAEILDRFVPRPWMFDIVDSLRTGGVPLGILSDQTNWLDELDARYDVFRRFDVVLNSFHAGRTKNEAAFFDMALQRLGTPAGATLFVDDNENNVAVGRGRGLHCILYAEKDAFLSEFAKFLPRI